MTGKQSHKIIGEGSYGCVVKPSLKCGKNEPEPKTYKNTISKIMTKRHAKQEIEEFEKVLNIPDIEQHFIPKPHICKPNEDETYKNLLATCENKLIKQPDAHPRILIMEDGGITLEKVLEIIPNMNHGEFKQFVCAWRQIIDSICFLWKHKIMHHDLKLANIVYQMKNGKIRLIDFGKVKTMDTFIHNSKINENFEGVEWFNYPTENNCTNQVHYDTKSRCQLLKQTIPYNEFIVKAAMTFDTYGIGVAFQDMLDTLRENYETREDVSVEMYFGIPWAFFEEFEMIAKNMYEPDIVKRINNPDSFLKQFDALCKTYHVQCKPSNRLSVKMKKRLEEVPHVVPETIFQNVKLYPAAASKKQECERKGKRFNPYTKKCVRKCNRKKNMIRLNQPPTVTRKKGVFKCIKKK